MKLPKQQEILNLYVSILQEVKGRLTFIDHVLMGGLAELPGVARKEFMHLQFRFLCELTALGCLAAHGDMIETSSLKGEWRAHEIMKALEALNPDFYPKPVGKMIRTGDGIHFDDPIGKPITKNEMLGLYGKSGNILHRGNLKKLLKPESPIQNTFPDEMRLVQGIRDLLSGHRISLLDGKFQVICLFGDKDQPVTAAIAGTIAIEKGLG